MVKKVCGKKYYEKVKMKYSKNIHPICQSLMIASAAIVVGFPTAHAADSITEAFTGGTPYVDLNLRFEAAQQDNALEDAEALTLRTRLGYKTGSFNGFSAVLELEDSREVFGVDNFSVPPAGVRPGEFTVIADPETTELDQGYIQYSGGGFTAKLGRQVIALDGQRFIGHVGWRQDRQTFDAFSLTYSPTESIKLTGAQLTQRNRIFAEEADIESEDTLLNAAFTTSFGKFVAYAYLLEVDIDVDNSLDTIGISFSGSAPVGSNKILYTAEFASQEIDDAIDTEYLWLEGGVSFSGITAKVGLESLGSDDGIGGFAAPLGTLHKFNGWTDQFLTTPAEGLNDFYVSATGKVGGGTWLAAYHSFRSDEDAEGGFDDLGEEINLQYVRPFGKNYAIGVKYGSYSAGDAVFGKVDADKFWFWLNAKFQ